MKVHEMISIEYLNHKGKSSSESEVGSFLLTFLTCFLFVLQQVDMMSIGTF